ncbi:MAG: RNA polymerase sigma factor, partial [bacterium]|nr:RNA polymerase sigma factor [bacterium]
MEDNNSFNESELIGRLKASDPAAFKFLVETFQDRIINTCYRFLYHREDAEDIAQEVFIEVYRSVGAFREQSKLSTWLYRIAVTKSIDFIRKKKRKKRFALIKSMFALQEEGKEIPDLDGNPLDNLQDEERMGILQEAVNGLPENQRIAFTLSKCEGFGNKEIAGIIGTSLSSVESLMHRAKANLRKKLHVYFENELNKKKTSAHLLFFTFFLLT